MTTSATLLRHRLVLLEAARGEHGLGDHGVWGAMERKVRLATAVSGVSERPELAPSDRFRYGERAYPSLEGAVLTSSGTSVLGLLDLG